MILKGRISTIYGDGSTVSVVSYESGAVSPPLVVPFFLHGALTVGCEVIYTEFSDNTGIVISRADGDWNHSLMEVVD